MNYLLGANSAICKSFSNLLIKNNEDFIICSESICEIDNVLIVENYYDFITINVEVGDTIFFFSAVTNLNFCENNRKICWDKNFNIPLKISNYCELNKINLVLISSASVYGENYGKSKSPISYYGTLKNNLEEKVKSKNYTMTLRLFSTYGKFQDKLFIYEFIERCKKFIDSSERNSKIISYSDKKSSRDYIHLDGISTLLYEISKKGIVSGIHEISSGKSVRMIEVENLILLKLNIDTNNIVKMEPSSIKPKIWEPQTQNISYYDVDLANFAFPYKIDDLIKRICAE